MQQSVTEDCLLMYLYYVLLIIFSFNWLILIKYDYPNAGKNAEKMEGEGVKDITRNWTQIHDP